MTKASKEPCATITPPDKPGSNLPGRRVEANPFLSDRRRADYLDRPSKGGQRFACKMTKLLPPSRFIRRPGTRAAVTADAIANPSCWPARRYYADRRAEQGDPRPAGAAASAADAGRHPAHCRRDALPAGKRAASLLSALRPVRARWRTGLSALQAKMKTAACHQRTLCEGGDLPT